jgi:hypothetical protein
MKANNIGHVREKKFTHESETKTHFMHCSYRNIQLFKVKLLHSLSVADLKNYGGSYLFSLFSKKTNIITYKIMHRSYFR